MKEKDLPTSMTLGVYWYIDEDTKKVVFDEDSMLEEYEAKIKGLNETYGDVEIDTEVPN